jgi:hypothetical protein
MTQYVTQWLLLLAGRQELHRVWGRFDHQRPGLDASQMLMMTAAFVLLVGSVLVWHRITGRTSRHFCDSSTKLFHELCSAHGLKFSTRRLLKRLARSRGIKDFALLFVEPQHLDTKSLPGQLNSSVAELRQLHDKLYR